MLINNCHSRKRSRWSVSAILLVFIVGLTPLPSTAYAGDDLTELSLEELASLEITSVAKKPQRLQEAAAAIFVVSQEDLTRSGATSIPEALRMVPGLQVARIDANKWAVSARGGNARFANKLLVLMDGRAIYEPSFSGVYWEVQDTVMADIERIEVIRGPGATLWGANAVNGVINIITKKAADTQGGLVELAYGTADPGLSVTTRYGGTMGSDGAYRIYAKGFRRSAGEDPEGDSTDDQWHNLQTGFRSDWQGTGTHRFTLQGDLYQGQADGQTRQTSDITLLRIDQIEKIRFSGANLLGRWQHKGTSAQLYYDFTQRRDLGLSQKRHTVDVELQHRFDVGKRQEFVVGSGYRMSIDDIDQSEYMRVEDEHVTDHLFSGFIQDEIRLIEDRITLTLGSKFEHNDYSGFEFQPSARLLYTPSGAQTLWASVSRAVRTPSRVERDGGINVNPVPAMPPMAPLPQLPVVQGNDDFDAEDLVAWEVGYRYLPRGDFSIDLAAFYNQYTHLRTGELDLSPTLVMGPVPYLRIPVLIDNKMQADAYGIELAADWKPAAQWRFQLAYTGLVIDYDLDSDSQDIGQIDLVEGTDPHHQLSLRTSYDIADNLQLDLWLRYVGQLDGPEIDIDQYMTADLRLAWQPKSGMELSVVGQNLLGGGHLEFDPEIGSPDYEVAPSVYGMIRWNF